VTGWLRRKRLDEPAFLVRHAEVSAALTARFAAEPDVADVADVAESGTPDP
jgi:hypothetical protein